MDHQKFGAFSNLGASSHYLNGLKERPAWKRGPKEAQGVVHERERESMER